MIKSFLRDRIPLDRAPSMLAGGASFAHVFGTVLVFLLGIQALTGVALAAFYSPSTTDAWASVAFIQDQAAWGWMIRGLHYHGGSALVIVDRKSAVVKLPGERGPPPRPPSSASAGCTAPRAGSLQVEQAPTTRSPVAQNSGRHGRCCWLTGIDFARVCLAALQGGQADASPHRSVARLAIHRAALE